MSDERADLDLDVATLRWACGRISTRINSLRRELPTLRRDWTDTDRMRDAQAQALEHQHAELWSAVELARRDS